MLEYEGFQLRQKMQNYGGIWAEALYLGVQGCCFFLGWELEIFPQMQWSWMQKWEFESQRRKARFWFD
jgi:hypothetical protein